jgi:hypothetical protein
MRRRLLSSGLRRCAVVALRRLVRVEVVSEAGGPQRPAQGRTDTLNGETAPDTVAGLPCTDQRTETRRLHERHQVHIDHQPIRTRGKRLRDHLTEPLSGALLELTTQHQDDLTGKPRLNIDRQSHDAPRLSACPEPDPTGSRITRNRCRTASDVRPAEPEPDRCAAVTSPASPQDVQSHRVRPGHTTV